MNECLLIKGSAEISKIGAFRREGVLTWKHLYLPSKVYIQALKGIYGVPGTA